MSESEGLKATIQSAMKDAMRAKDKDLLKTIRLITAAIKQVEVDERIEVDDTRVLMILEKMLKQRRESISQFNEAGREDLVAIEEAEMEIIKRFMPEPLDTSAITGLVKDAISASGAASVKDMGKVMNALRPKIQGRADMSEVSALVKDLLS